MTTKMFRYEEKVLNPIHTTVSYGTNGNVFLTNLEQDQVVDLIVAPVAPWGDRKAMGSVLMDIAENRGWW